MCQPLSQSFFSHHSLVPVTSALKIAFTNHRRARSNATAKESPPGLTKREWPDEAGNHARPGSHTSVAQAPYASLGNQCEMSLVHVNTTSGALAPPSKGPSFSFGSAVYITHENRTRSDGELHVRLFLQKSARDTKVGVKLLCAAEGVREPSVSRGLVEVLASDVCMGRAVLDVTCAVSVMNGLVGNIALSEALDLPRDRNGDIDMLARDDYVANHPTTRLILNSVVLLDHIVQNLLGWMEDSAGVAEDLDGEGEGDIGREELGRADFRGGVGGSRGAGSSGTACGAGWGDARRNPGKGSRMQHLVRQHGGVEAVCRLIHTVFWAKQVGTPCSRCAYSLCAIAHMCYVALSMRAYLHGHSPPPSLSLSPPPLSIVPAEAERHTEALPNRSTATHTQALMHSCKHTKTTHSSRCRWT